MNVLNRAVKLSTMLAISAVLFSGCVSWKHGWEMKPFKASGKLEAGAVKEYAAKLEKSAVTRRQIQDLVESLQYTLAVEPDNYEVTVKLSRAWLALAVGHARDNGEKGEYFRRSIGLAEKAMYLDQAFAARVDQAAGKKICVPLIVDSLESGQADAMATWALATLLYFEESLSEVLKITNESKVDGVVAVIDRLDAVSPGYGKGLTSALRGLASAVRPGAKQVTSSDMFDAAVAAGPDSLLNYWLRAVYLYRNFGDKVSAMEDMKKIKGLDLSASFGFMPLNRVIRLEAEKCSR